MFPFRSPATVNEIFCAFHVDVVPTKTPVTILRVQDIMQQNLSIQAICVIVFWTKSKSKTNKFAKTEAR